MAIEFDDSRDWAFFIRDGKTLTNGNGFANRWSEQVLAALRSGGALDNMEDGTTPPATDKFWLDKNSDPAVLKEWDSINSVWTPMSFDRLFGRAIITELTNVGGTADAVTVDAPASFIDNRVYGLVPTATNTGAATIQVAGVGTYDIVYPNGDPISAGELAANLRTPLLFKNGRFEIVFGANAGSIKRSETDPTGYQFVSSDPDLSNDPDKLALRGDVDANLVLQYAADDTALKALDIGSRKAALNLANEGWWLPTSDDISAQITAGDPRYQPTSGDATGASGGWYRAGSVSSDQIRISLGANYLYWGDVMRVGGEAVKHNGELGVGGKGGFLWDDYGGSTSSSWMEARAIIAASGKSSNGYGPALSGSLLGPGTANVHTLFLTEAPDESIGTNGFASYAEVRRGLLRGVTRAMEMDSVNLLESPATGPFNPYGSLSALGNGLGTTYGLVMASGGGGPGVAAENVYDSDVAIQITGNGAYWWTGLNFSAGGLKADDVTGRTHAIKMAHNQALEWHSYSDHALAASIVSLISAETYKQELQFSNSGLSFIAASGNALFRINNSSTAANGFVITPANSLGAARIEPLTSDTNGSGLLRGKGVGGWIIQDGSANTVINVQGASKLGLYGAAPVTKQAVTGALSSVSDTNAKDVLTSLLSALSTLGAITNSTT